MVLVGLPNGDLACTAAIQVNRHSEDRYMAVLVSRFVKSTQFYSERESSGLGATIALNFVKLTPFAVLHYLHSIIRPTNRTTALPTSEQLDSALTAYI